MDYRLNNEALVACVVAQVVKNGRSDLTLAVVTTNLLMHNKERKRIKADTDREKIVTTVNKVDGGLLTIIMNSLVVMIQGGCMQFEDGELFLTIAGEKMCEQMSDGRCDVLTDMLNDMPAVIGKIEQMKDEVTDNRYVIAL